MATTAKETPVDDFRQVTGPGQLTAAGTATLAQIAAEAIRGLNQATRHDAGLDQPSAAYDVTGALSLAASRLPQLLAQMTRCLDHALAAGRLGHDLGQDPAPNISAAGIFLDDARASAAALASDLNQAQQQLAPINSHPRHHKDQP
jgi:hypothetical protein